MGTLSTLLLRLIQLSAVFLVRIKSLRAECGYLLSDPCFASIGNTLPSSNDYIKLSSGKEYVFYFDMKTKASAISIAASILFGTVDLYSAINRFPTQTDADYSTFNNERQDFLTMNTDTYSTSDKIYTLIKARTDTKFKVTIGNPVIPTILEEGLPLRGDVLIGHNILFLYRPPTGAYFGISLTTVLLADGDPDMTITAPPYQGIKGRSWKASEIGSDFIQIQTEPGEWGGDFIVNVTCKVSAAFTIVATPSPDVQPTRLLSGYPIQSYAFDDKERYFTLQVPPGNLDVAIDVIGMGVQTFVNANSTQSQKPIFHYGIVPNSDWSSLEPGHASFVITNRDSKRISDGGAYLITVRGVSGGLFSIKAFVSNTVLTLMDGVLVSGTVYKGSYVYYRTYNAWPSDYTIFDLNPLIGDADLMLSCSLVATGDDSGYPSKTAAHYRWGSLEEGEDTLSISSLSAKECQDKVFYIAVYGKSSAGAYFELTGIHQGNDLRLFPGSIRTGKLFANLATNFVLDMGVQQSSVTIRVTPTVGDCDVYVKMGDMVSLENYDFSSESSGMITEEVYIPESKVVCIPDNAQVYAGKCVLSIMVLAVKTTEFSIVAFLEDTTLMLTDGLPLSETVARGRYQFYSYVPFQSGNVSIVLSVLNGAPVMYLSTIQQRPTAITNSTIINSNFIYGNLPVATLYVRKNELLYIGVNTLSTVDDAKYTIRASLISAQHPTPIYEVINGIAQFDYLEPYSWKYYAMTLHEGFEDIMVRVVDFVSHVDVFVSTCPYVSVRRCRGLGDSGERLPSFLPNETYNIGSSVESYIHFINILRQEIASTTYIVGIRSQQSFITEYAVSMTLDKSLLLLQPGVSIIDHVEPKDVDFFAFYLDAKDKAVRITLTPISGDPDLVVVSQMGEMWKSTAVGLDTIELDPYVDSRACFHCLYTIMVSSVYASTYSILASYESTVSHLIDGHPISAHCEANDINYYIFQNYYGNNRDLRITLTPISGDPVMFVSIGAENPTWHKFDYEPSNQYEGASQQVDVARTDKAFLPCLTDHCSIRIGVHSTISSQYSLTLTSSLTATLLQVGTSHSGSVGEDSIAMYKVIVNRISYALEMTITPTSGHVDVFLSCGVKTIVPDASDAMWTINPDLKNRLVLTSGMAELQNCLNGTTIFMAVVGRTAASFSIYVSYMDETVPTLRVGHSLEGVVKNFGFNYYAIPIGHNLQDVRVSASVTSGSVSLFASLSWDARPVWNTTIGAVSSFVFAGNVHSNVLSVSTQQLQAVCGKDASCYLIVGALGSIQQQTTSSYRILYTVENTIVTLSSGISIRGVVTQHHYSYFKYTQMIPHTDIIVTVTTLSGHPELYLSVSVIRPTAKNSTWQSVTIGSETVLVPADELEVHCPRSPVLDVGCDLFISVFGKTDASFSIVATMQEGSASPILLLDNHAQKGKVETGRYVYYKYIIGSNSSEFLSESIEFTLTQSDHGEQDIFVSFGETSEPSATSYDYKSTTFIGSSTEVIITSSMKHFCFNCLVKLAVYGVSSGEYTIVAHSKGFQSLHTGVAMGGHIDQHKYRYYTYLNTDPVTDITITVTRITGNPFIVVKTFTSLKDGQPSLPTQEDSIWSTHRLGGGTVIISSSHQQYCFDCEYIIGVYGFTNTTYSVLVSSTLDSIVKLTRNRPQLGSGATGSMLYYKTIFGSSVEDITVSLTCLDTGAADLYISLFNSSSASSGWTLPNAKDPSSYTMTSAAKFNDVLFIPGPHTLGTVIIIGVYVLSTTHFHLIASSSQDLLIIQPGMPQNHFVERGDTAYFRFPIYTVEDIQITLTARTGDAGLVVSYAYQRPYCTLSENPWATTNCFNYTWTSQMYSIDHILISMDYPCQPTLLSTKVSNSCNDDMFAKFTELYIGVFGLLSSQFTILAQSVGDNVQLIAGHRQAGVTHEGYICSHRSRGSGACLMDSSVREQVQIAYFSFYVAAQVKKSASRSSSSLFVSLSPKCPSSSNSTRSDTQACIPGCACGKLSLYIRSCALEGCPADAMFPSPLSGQFDYQLHEVEPRGSSLFITEDPTAQSFVNSFCDPTKEPSGCIYFLAVISRVPKAVATFSISVRTPQHVAVIPCDSAAPDGIRVGFVDSTVDYPTSYYEVCSGSSSGSDGGGNNAKLTFSLEECASTGAMQLYARSDADNCATMLPLPSSSSWNYFSNELETCMRVHENGASRKRCEPNDNADGPVLLVPSGVGNYYLMVNGTGEFILNIHSTDSEGNALAPSLVRPGIDEIVSSVDVHVDPMRAFVRLSWTATSVLLPGMSTPVRSSEVKYTAYVISIVEYESILNNLGGILKPVLDTACGLAYLESRFKGAVRVIPIPTQNADAVNMSHVIRGLPSDTKYRIALTASCDGECFRQLSKVIPKASAVCAGAVDCKTQTLAYRLSDAVLVGESLIQQRRHESRRLWLIVMTSIVGMSVVLVTLMITGIVIMSRYYQRIRSEDDGARPQLELAAMSQEPPMESTDALSFNPPERKPSKWGKIGIRSKQTFQPLIDASNDDSAL